jgi:hypothetical protein
MVGANIIQECQHTIAVTVFKKQLPLPLGEEEGESVESRQNLKTEIEW